VALKYRADDEVRPAPTTVTLTADPASDARLDAYASAEPQVRSPDRYRLITEHGRGGLGRVFRAYDRELGRDVALKEILHGDAVSRARFMREAKITARLEHPGIVPVHEAGCWADGTPYYAMKLVSGSPLRDLIAAQPTIDGRLGLLHHVIAVADAIAYAHRRNIIHRDLKPANVIVGDFGETIVIDWGLAKELAEPDEPAEPSGGRPRPATRDPELTEAGSVIGTRAYMPPEQLRGEPVDQRADVFAIGAMLWQLCAPHQEPPADSADRHAVLRAAKIDRDLIAIIDKAVDTAPARRYPDAGALAADLKAFEAGFRITARRYSLYAVVAHWTRRRRALALAALAFVCLLASGTVGLAVLYSAAQRSAGTAHAALIDSWVQRGQQALFDGMYTRALPLLAQAYRAGDSSIAVRAMLHRVIKILDRPRLAALADPVGARFRAGGREMMVLDAGGDAAIVEVATGRVTGWLEPRAKPNAGSYGRISDDGAVVAVTRADTLAIWDGTTTRSIRLDHIPDVQSLQLAFDAGNTRLAMTEDHEVMLRKIDGTRLWQRSLPDFAQDVVVVGDGLVVLAAPTVSSLADQHTWLVSASRALDLGPASRIWPYGADHFLTGEPQRVAQRDAAGGIVTSYPVAQFVHGRIAIGGTLIAFGYSSGAIEVMDARTATRTGLLVGHTSEIMAMAFSGDGKRLVSTSLDLSARIWDVERSRELFRYAGLDNTPNAVDIDPTGRQFAATTVQGVALWPIDDPAAERIMELPEQVGAASFAGHGSRIVSSSDHGVELWDTATGALLEYIKIAVNDRAHASPDMRLVAIPRADRPEIEIRALPGAALLATLHTTSIPTCAVFDHAGRRVATANGEGLIELWTPEGAKLATLRGHNTVVQVVEFSPDDRQLISGGNDQTARLWDAASGRELGRIDHTDLVMAARFDPTGTRVAAAGGDQRATLWNPQTRTVIRTFPQGGFVNAIALGDTLLADATASGAVELWDLATGREAGRFHHAGVTTTADFDGDRLLTTAIDGRLILWDVSTAVGPPDQVVAFACRTLRAGDLESRALLDCPAR
jgi:WD40 repeat protein